MDILAKFRDMAKRKRRVIVLPEAEDERILLAATKIKQEGIASPLLLGDDKKIKQSAEKLHIEISDIPVINPAGSPNFPEYVKQYQKNRPNVTERVAEKLVRKSLLFGSMMVARGDADGIVAGATHTTSSVIQSAALTIGFQRGISAPSSFFIMVLPHPLEGRDILVFADCAVSIKPTAEELAEIAVVTGRNAKKLLDIEPKIAMLSFSTKGSASHAETEKVIRATKMARTMAPELEIDGELQADAALIQRVAEKKVKQSSVAGAANVLIFPDLNSANIAYKLVQYLGKAQAIGPFLQGFARPITDLSRGASAKDVIDAVAVTSVMADESRN